MVTAKSGSTVIIKYIPDLPLTALRWTSSKSVIYPFLALCSGHLYFCSALRVSPFLTALETLNGTDSRGALNLP